MLQVEVLPFGTFWIFFYPQIFHPYEGMAQTKVMVVTVASSSAWSCLVGQLVSDPFEPFCPMEFGPPARFGLSTLCLYPTV